MDQKRREGDVSRRDLFGALGGAASLAALNGCAVQPDQGAAPEATGRVANALLSGPDATGPLSLPPIQEIRLPITTAAAQRSELCLPP